MRWDNVYIAGVGSYLPEKVETAEEAIAQGRYTAEKIAMNGYRAVRIAGDDETGPTMAVHAAREAIARSGLGPDDFGLFVHSYIGFQGMDYWTPASYIQRETVGGNGLAVELRQACNGGLAALDVAAAFVSARDTAALITGGDASRLPYIDRWAADEQTVEGDGAAAIVLSSRGGFAKVRATLSYSDPSLEPTVRGDEKFTFGPFMDGKPLNVAARKKSFQLEADMNFEEMIEKVTAGAEISLKRILAEAEIDIPDVKFFLHQTIAESIANFALFGLLGVDRKTTNYDWGQANTGSVSAIDQYIGLDRIIAERDPQPGDIAIMQGTGAGYIWSLAVLEFIERPHWTQ